jgi:endonuclease/exonuclease/phosphatase family metal-dependent hydrolase
MKLPNRIRPWFIGVALVLPAGALGLSARAADTPLRVMSFNVRYGTAPDGEDSWGKRTGLFFETIERFQPDLIGFQEVIAAQYDAIAERMKGHAFSGVAREDGKRKGEFSSIGYRTERFTKLAEGTFWLSETPEVAGSKSWDSSLPRVCSWVRLRETATGREFVFANTHFDHRGVVARREAARVLSERIGPIAAGVPAILTGDFNINEDNPAYAALVKPPKAEWISWIDSYRTLYPQRQPDEASFNGFKGTVQGSRIDFVFHTAHYRATSATIDRFSRQGRYPSDHYPVTAVLELKK